MILNISTPNFLVCTDPDYQLNKALSTTNQLSVIVSTVIVSNRANGIKMKTLTDLQGMLWNAIAGDVPIGTFVDHRKHSNPYQSRYGEA